MFLFPRNAGKFDRNTRKDPIEVDELERKKKKGKKEDGEEKKEGVQRKNCFACAREVKER